MVICLRPREPFALEEIGKFLDAFRLQSDLATGLATAGFGAIIFTWLRIYGVVAGKELSNFRQPLWLIVPAILFLVSLAMSYLISGTITGYYFELADGANQQTHKAIADPVEHFRSQYAPTMQPLGFIQLASSVLGVLVVAGWYMANVFETSRRFRGGRS